MLFLLADEKQVSSRNNYVPPCPYCWALSSKVLMEIVLTPAVGLFGASWLTVCRSGRDISYPDEQCNVQHYFTICRLCRDVELCVSHEWCYNVQYNVHTMIIEYFHCTDVENCVRHEWCCNVQSYVQNDDWIFPLHGWRMSLAVNDVIMYNHV